MFRKHWKHFKEPLQLLVLILFPSTAPVLQVSAAPIQCDVTMVWTASLPLPCRCSSHPASGNAFQPALCSVRATGQTWLLNSGCGSPGLEVPCV